MLSYEVLSNLDMSASQYALPPEKPAVTRVMASIASRLIRLIRRGCFRMYLSAFDSSSTKNPYIKRTSVIMRSAFEEKGWVASSAFEFHH